MTADELFTKTKNLLESHGTNASIIRSIALMPKGYRQMPETIRAGMIFHPSVDGVIVWSSATIRDRDRAIQFWERGAPPPCAGYNKRQSKQNKKFLADWGLTKAKFPV